MGLVDVGVIIVGRLNIAPPIVVGTWPMAILPWQHVEYLFTYLLKKGH